MAEIEDFEYEKNKKVKISIIFFFFMVISFFLIITFIGITESDKKTPNLKRKDIDYASRGNILSAKGMIFADSNILYKVIIYKKYLDPNKKNLLVDLFSKYTGIDKDILNKRLLEDSNKIVLATNINTKMAKSLKELRGDLTRIKVFRAIKKGSSFYKGMDIVKYNESRDYPLKDTLEPYLGYINHHDNGETYGVYGLEKYYNNLLTNSKDKILEGQRDKQGIIIRDKNNKTIKKEDGFDIITNIDLKLQKVIEQILTKQKEKLQAKEIVAAVMDSSTGKILAVASSRRYNPKHKIVDALTISAIRYIYEPGSVIKPIFFSLLYKEKKVKLEEIINTHNGRIKLSNGKVVTDEHRYPFLSAKDVIVHSSNVGMTELSARANPLKIVDGFKSFGFTKKSGIDLSYELSGTIPEVVDLQNSVIRANLSYGYRIRANFFQLLSAYSVFNNGGFRVIPKIASIKVTTKGVKEWIEAVKPIKVLPKMVANNMHRVLNEVVTRGTGKATFIDGLDIGGKTGTSQITQKGHYIRKYNSSFFGFANDANYHFTIGVLVIEPNPKGYVHFASQSAVPTFRMIVESMIEQGLLKPRSK